MAAKLFVVLALGFLVTDAYRPITFTMKRQNRITYDNAVTKSPYPILSLGHSKSDTTPSTTTVGKTTKKNVPQNMDQNELRLDFWRTFLNYLEEQPVIILSEPDVEKQLEYIQDPKSEYY